MPDEIISKIIIDEQAVSKLIQWNLDLPIPHLMKSSSYEGT